jgi:ABC-type iron transport system FetAB ATPase subunit
MTPEWASAAANFGIGITTLTALVVTSCLSVEQLTLSRQQVEVTRQQSELMRQTVQNEMIYNMQRDARQLSADYVAGRARANAFFPLM